MLPDERGLSLPPDGGQIMEAVESRLQDDHETAELLDLLRIGEATALQVDASNTRLRVMLRRKGVMLP